MSALEAVSTGRADAYVGNLANAKYLINHHGFYNLKVVPSTPFERHTQAMGVRKDWPELVSIINKGLQSISAEQRIAIEHKWGTVEGKSSQLPLPMPPRFNKTQFLLKTGVWSFSPAHRRGGFFGGQIKKYKKIIDIAAKLRQPRFP